jgi:hypothetical protein
MFYLETVPMNRLVAVDEPDAASVLPNRNSRHRGRPASPPSSLRACAAAAAADGTVPT